MLDKICGMNITYLRYSFEYFLKSMKRLNITFIELWGGAPHFYVNDLTYMQIKEVYNKIKKHDIEIEFFTPEQCMYPINLSAKDETLRKRSIDYFIKCVDVSNSLEVSKMLITSGLGYFDEPESECWKRAKESLSQVSEYAESQDITLALEPLSYFESNVVTNIDTLKKMLNDVQSPNLKAMVDTVPMALENETLQQYFETFGKDLIHIHFIDTDTFHSHLAWGDGKLQLSDYLKVINHYEYPGKLTLELTGSRYTNDPEKALEKSINAIKNVANR